MFQHANSRTKAKNLRTVDYDVGIRGNLDAYSNDMKLMRLISCFEIESWLWAKVYVFPLCANNPAGSLSISPPG